MNFRGQANGFPLSEKIAEQSVIGILETMLSFALEIKCSWGVNIIKKQVGKKHFPIPSPSPVPPVSLLSQAGLRATM